MVLEGKKKYKEILLAECNCGDWEENLRITSYYDPDDEAEVYLRVNTSKICLWRWIRDYFRGKFWVEIILSKDDLLRMKKFIERTIEKWDEHSR